MSKNIEIMVIEGHGEGGTELSAFDSALCDAGVGDYNLIYLSSVVPVGATVKIAEKFFGRRERCW